MRPFQDQEYEALPVEEKLEFEEPEILVDQPRRRITILAFLVFILTVASVLAIVVVATVWTTIPLAAEPPLVDSPVDDPELFLEHAVRAPGDRYMIGVGKADITG
jgi:hypothetical protein